MRKLFRHIAAAITAIVLLAGGATDCHAQLFKKKKKEKKEKEQKEIRDYTHSVGIAVGSSYGLAYKYFFKDNWALKVDATANIYKGIGGGLEGMGGEVPFGNFDFNPNVVYYKQLKTFRTCKLDFFAGGGTTFGYDWFQKRWYSTHRCIDGRYKSEIMVDDVDSFVWGLNGVLGLEINLAIPMTIEFDFRPGYGLWASGPIFDECRGYKSEWNENKHKSEYYYCKRPDWCTPVGSFFDWSVNATISYKF